jgi:hypothetical protein
MEAMAVAHVHVVALTTPVDHKGAARGEDPELILVVGKEANPAVAAVAVGAHFSLVALRVEAALEDSMGKGAVVAVLALSSLPEALTGLAGVCEGLWIASSHFFAGMKERALTPVMLIVPLALDHFELIHS